MNKKERYEMVCRGRMTLPTIAAYEFWIWVMFRVHVKVQADGAGLVGVYCQDGWWNRLKWRLRKKKIQKFLDERKQVSIIIELHDRIR